MALLNIKKEDVVFLIKRLQGIPIMLLHHWRSFKKLLRWWAVCLVGGALIIIGFVKIKEFHERRWKKW